MISTLRVSTPSEREIVMVRAFDAPAELVFDALTQPELLRRWYAPTEWSLTRCEIDLRVGGAWRFELRRPDGRVVVQLGVYREISPPRRLVNTESWEDWDPGACLVTTELSERAGVTTLTSTILFPTSEARDIVLNGGLKDNAADNYDKLAAFLGATFRRDVVVRRVLPTTPDRAWKAWNDAELVRQWWGPVGFTCPVAKMDVRRGGKSIVCMRSPDGRDLYSVWEYSSVQAPTRLEYVFNLSDASGAKVDPTALGMPADFPRDVRHVVTFTPVASGTELSVTEYGYSSPQFYELSKLGLEQCIDKLEASLGSIDGIPATANTPNR
jgi:uncharacterized protein YndB with AHSA1/START domain